MPNSVNLSSYSKRDKVELLKLLEEKSRRSRMKKLWAYYPETGLLSRHKYPKHMQFFKMGATKPQRCILAANRIGKTEGIGGYELTLHLTGLYPDWWDGCRFDKPISAWAAGTTGTTVRDIIQFKLLGVKNDVGTGLIPGDLIAGMRPKAGGVPDAIDIIKVTHKSGGVSSLGLKSYAEGRKSFEGTEKHVIWCDEEPPYDIYTECLVRLMTTSGIMMCTFTPLLGISDTVMYFLPTGQIDEADNESGKFVMMADWDDAPHLTREQKDLLYSSLPPHQRDARSKGIPQLGSGAIYPVPESEIIVDDFEIPEHWPRVYGMDVGWNRTAAVWGAIDRESDTIYLYSEHYLGESEPPMHTAAINARGVWIPGAIDPAARGRSQNDGKMLLQDYIDLGLNLTNADNAVEAGIYNVWTRLSTGRLKVFKSLNNWMTEFRIYRRDEKGKVVKQNDHLMDCTRYLVQTGISIATIKPVVTGKRRLRVQSEYPF